MVAAVIGCCGGPCDRVRWLAGQVCIVHLPSTFKQCHLIALVRARLLR